MELICSFCGQRISSTKPMELCPNCGTKLSEGMQAGAKTAFGVEGDLSEEKTILTNQPNPFAAGKSPMPRAGSEAETVVSSSPRPAAPPTPRPGDSYVPFAGNSGIRDLVKEPGVSPPAGDLDDPGKTSVLPEHKKAGTPSSPRQYPPSDAPVPAPAPIRETDAGSATDYREGGAASEDDADPDRLIGVNLGGYVIKKKIGAGGMGAVCLARQVSLDRDVALKILPGRFARDPDFVARFTREALSAAQLNHHNVVQVHDVGSAKNVHYISMEFVKGENLGSITRREGKVSVEVAAGYVLQAARGLLYAHERGIIHRDIKPENLMINEHGIVKIADMGLAKMSGTTERSVGLDTGNADLLKEQAYGNLTGVNVAMGTPAYMAPEQGRDASKVDHRADQYSLGCTLYYLIAGKTPFSGKTSFEIISKHATEPLVPLDSIVKNVPKELSYIIEKMLAKNPAERYPSLREAVEALESYLGIESKQGAYTPREHHVAILEKEQKEYYAAATLKIRKLCVAGFFALFALLMVVSVLSGSFFWSSAFFGILVMTPVINFIVNGFLTREFLFRRVRSVFFGMSIKNWCITIGGTLGVLVLMFLFGQFLPWLLVSVFCVGMAVAYQVFVLRRLRKERTAHLFATQEMLKQLRIRGVDEDAIQEFVCRFSGKDWEEFFEDLFGYEDMVKQRLRYQAREKTHPRRRYSTWRDPIARWLDEVEEKRKKAREQRQLAKAEKARLKAQGLDEASAQKESEKIAQEAVDEGLLKKTAILVAPTRAEIERIDRELHASARSGRPGMFNFLFRMVRLAVGLGVTGSAGVVLASFVKLPVPQALIGPVKTIYADHNSYAAFLGGIPVLIVGLLLLATVLSKRVILPILVLLGVALAAFNKPLSAMIIQSQPLFTVGFAYCVGLALALAGFVLMIMAKVTGRDF